MEPCLHSPIYLHGVHSGFTFTVFRASRRISLPIFVLPLGLQTVLHPYEVAAKSFVSIWLFVFKTERHETVNLVTARFPECNEIHGVLHKLMVALTIFTSFELFPLCAK